MTGYKYEFCNLYLPSDYVNDEYGIRIEPTDIAEGFDEERRDIGSQYRTGYWHTANCYIQHEMERADQLADWLIYIYSFSQYRDVNWFERFSIEEDGEHGYGRNSYTCSIDNTKIPLIRGVIGSSMPLCLDEFVDTALETFDQTSEEERGRIIRSLNLFLEAGIDTYWMIKFLFHWIVLESNANYNYDDYLQGPGEPIFTEDEIQTLRKTVIGHLDDICWNSDQINHVDYILDQNHLYQASSKTKIKIYLEHLNIGFEIEEIEDIIDMARSTRNPIVHRIDESRLMNNDGIVTDIRKINFYVLLRLLGVGEEMQKRLVTPKIIGPDVQHD